MAKYYLMDSSLYQMIIRPMRLRSFFIFQKEDKQFIPQCKRIRSDPLVGRSVSFCQYIPFTPIQVHFTPDSPPAHQASSRVNNHSIHRYSEASLPQIRQYPASDPYQTLAHSSNLPYPHPG